jgi:hypothetical protein
MVSREALQGLRGKYREMLAMRLAHDRREEKDPRARMAELSLRFPGALREIDELELGAIRQRLVALDAVLQGTGAVEGWMEAIARFHALARGALCAKRWLARRRHVDDDVERAYAVAVPRLAFPDDARSWQGELERIASPPRGRLNEVIFARMSRELGASESELKLLVFGAPRRLRRQGH